MYIYIYTYIYVYILFLYNKALVEEWFYWFSFDPTKDVTYLTAVVLLVVVTAKLEAVVLPAPQSGLTAVIVLCVAVTLAQPTGSLRRAAVTLQLLLRQESPLAPLPRLGLLTHPENNTRIQGLTRPSLLGY